MNLLMRIVRGFFGFWYQFIIGDDWLGAAGVAVLVGGTWLLMRFSVTVYWFGPLTIVTTAVILVARALRRSASSSSGS